MIPTCGRTLCQVLKGTCYNWGTRGNVLSCPTPGRLNALTIPKFWQPKSKWPKKRRKTRTNTVKWYEWVECYHIAWGNYTLRNMCLWNSHKKFTAVLNHLGVDFSTNQKPGKSFCVGQPEEGKLHSRAILPIYIFGTGNLYKGISLFTLLIQQRNAFLPGNVFWLILPFFRIPIAWVVTTPGEVALYRTLVQTHSWSQPTWLHCNCCCSSSSPHSPVTLPRVNFLCL